jgi:RNA polymerase sigma-70 factor (ECF subfamily)
VTEHDHGTADAETLARARGHDTDAMADLWAIYHPQLLGLLRARRTAAPEDIASQVWIDVGRSIDRFDGDGVAFRRWLFTIAGRRVIDEHRRAWRRREVSVDSSQLPVRSEPDERWGWSLESAHAMLSPLSAATREVIMLRIVHDMSVPLVARATGRSEGNVRVLVHRGLRQLRERAASEHAVLSLRAIGRDEPDRSEVELEAEADLELSELASLAMAHH